MISLRCAALCAAIVSVLASSVSFAGVIRHDVPDANYTGLGNSAAYDSVGRVTFANNADWASGTLIASRWLITAGHVVRSNFINNTPSNVQFTVGGNTYTADQIYLNPGYVHNQSFNGNDIAIVRLSSGVGNVNPADLFTGSISPGSEGTYVGFGRTGTGLTGVQVTPAAKRGGTNDVDMFGNQFDVSWSSNVLLSDFDNPLSTADSSWGDTAPNALEYLPAEKDSGAGLFITDGGNSYLAGVVAFGLFDADTTSFDYGDAIASISIPGQMTWISSVVPEVRTGVVTGIGSVLAALGIVGGRIRRGRSQGQQD